ncbi:hypothetical protein [Shewanella mangrovisoli]|uniref:hypothetical protein n=1 Tax=Shewanella mangrovisoli TaxID=2864211 RepID=UPI0035B7838B
MQARLINHLKTIAKELVLYGLSGFLQFALQAANPFEMEVSARWGLSQALSLSSSSLTLTNNVKHSGETSAM